MDSIVRRILGESEPIEPTEDDAKEMPVEAPVESEVDELANLWTTGNKGEVVRRFIEMDNETSVKLVFAIGRDEALVLARMVDQQMEMNPGEGEETAPEGGESTEPEEIHASDDSGKGSEGFSWRDMFKGMGDAYRQS